MEGDDFSLTSVLSKLVDVDDGVVDRCFRGGGTGGGVGDERWPPPPTLNSSVSSRRRSVFSDDLRCFESADVDGLAVTVVFGVDLRPKPKR